MYLLFKNAFLKVKKSLGRFFSLALIVFVGVGFFVGIKSSSPDMVASVDSYYDQNNLMDFKIISTMGLTNNDVNSIKTLKNTKLVVPSYSLDAVSKGEAIRVHSIEDKINKVTLVNGRMPENLNECLGDSNYYKIGDSVEISSDVSDKLKNKTYTVVGTINSVLYTLKNYGISSVGNGKLASYIYIMRDNFVIDYYTEINVTAINAKESKTYSEEYDRYFKMLESELLELKPIRETKRYEEILEEATTKLFKSENDLKTARENGENELSKAKKELDAGKKEIDAAKAKLNTNSDDLNKTISDKTAEFDSAKKEIASAWDSINSNLAKEGIDIDEVDSKITILKNSIDTQNSSLNSLESGTPEYESILLQRNNYNTFYQELVVLQSSIKTLKEKETVLDSGIETFDKVIAQAKQEIENGEESIKKNQQKLDNGYLQYQKNLNEFNQKIADAEIQISKAKEDIKKIEKPQWYLLDRTDNAGYVELKDDTLKVSQISSVFPLFFLLIVALMSLNTMTRMIEEERGELGTLTSLGFSNFRIILIYIMYVFVAAIVGIVTGFFVGSYSIPRIIYSVYTANYNLPPFIVQLNMVMFMTILVISIVLMGVVTIIACLSELRNKPATLLRPVPPKNGKKIFLENINIIWNKLSFTWKVTIRNMFRYKKRVFMTLVGIAGCTALLLTGFGIRDSVDRIARTQYGDIFKYDDLIILQKEVKTIDSELANLLTSENIIDPTLIYQTSFKFEVGERDLETYMIVPENSEEFKKYYTLKSIKTDKIVPLSDDGVIITQKMAKLLKLNVGDTIKIRDTNNILYLLKVSDIVENYTFNYIYMNKDMYEEVFGRPALYNIIVSDNHADKSTMAKNLISSDKVSYVSYTNDNLNTFNKLVSGLNSIIYLIIVVSSLLALIVLYNLTTINISERKREVATLKVLGFYDNDVNEYIYRETIILSFIGILIGFVLGVLLHQYVIRLVETDSTVFIKIIRPLSYLYSFIITITLIFVIQLVTYFKLKKINMIESLKSVE